MKDNDIDLNKELEKLYEKLKEAKEHYKDAKSKYNLSIFLIIYDSAWFYINAITYFWLHYGFF